MSIRLADRREANGEGEREKRGKGRIGEGGTGGRGSSLGSREVGEMSDPIDELTVDLDIRLVRRGQVILDGTTAGLLRAISSTGSLLAAAKMAGIPYSRAWRAITSLERRLGRKVIAPRRGGRRGGGTELTEEGRRLLALYSRAEREVGRHQRPLTGRFERPDLLISGSHDLLLEHAVEASRGRTIEVHWIGSYGGILSLMMGDADVSGIHLLDVATGEYNEPVIRRMFPAGGVALLRGYDREVGWAMRRDLIFHERDLIEGKVVLANRNRGSGTRLLLDRRLAALAEEAGIKASELGRLVRGYGREYFTHTEACRAVVEGSADVTLTIRPVADMYGLAFRGILWERYDLLVRDDPDRIGLLREILEVLRDLEIPRGYRIPDELGSRIL